MRVARWALGEGGYVGHQVRVARCGHQVKFS